MLLFGAGEMCVSSLVEDSGQEMRDLTVDVVDGSWTELFCAAGNAISYKNRYTKSTLAADLLTWCYHVVYELKCIMAKPTFLVS